MTPQSKRFSFVAALLASLGMISVPLKAMAQVCGGTNVHRSTIRNLGSVSYVFVSDPDLNHWKAVIPADSTFGFNSANAPSVYVDYVPNPNTTLRAQVCRQAFTGTSASCGSLATSTTTGTSAVDLSVSTSGTYSSSNSVWDHYYIKVYTTAGSINRFIGAGINMPLYA